MARSIKPHDVKIASIGCGFFGRLQAAAWQSLAIEGARLVAVCDRDGGVAAGIAARLGGINWYVDVERMLDTEKPDLVDIATQMDTHQSLSQLCFDRGVAVVVQKPMTPAFADSVTLVESAKGRGLFFAVHENFRFQRTVRRIKELVESGAIGAPTWGRIGFRTGIDVYRNQPYLYGVERLVILDLGIHILDVARALFGEVERLSCETQRRNHLVRAEDTATMLLRHRSGAVTIAEATYENRRSESAEMFIEVEAESGGVEVGPDGVVTLYSASGRTQEQLDFDAPRDDPLRVVKDSVRPTCANILAAFQAGRPAETSGADNLRTLALVEAAYEAARTHATVEPII